MAQSKLSIHSRFVIRKAVVRKDLIQTLPLPRRLLDYISYKNCYSEQVECDSSPSPFRLILAEDGSGKGAEGCGSYRIENKQK
ncbi:hypothetical protein HA402_002462 [Bradysia odoriphaga]|nr:hypothetical protein HA402_002462 [Bradysia odoriphaga]